MTLEHGFHVDSPGLSAWDRGQPGLVGFLFYWLRSGLRDGFRFLLPGFLSRDETKERWEMVFFF
jgi:CubicO group peptidase (beta-lactamase class C family)